MLSGMLEIGAHLYDSVAFIFCFLVFRCWIKEGFEGLRFGLYYGPLILILIHNAAVYYSIVRAIRNSAQKNSVMIRLRLYLLAFFFVRIFSVVNRIQNAFMPNDPIFILYFLHSTFSPIQVCMRVFVTNVF
jgi:hypothetical protein